MLDRLENVSALSGLLCLLIHPVVVDRFTIFLLDSIMILGSEAVFFLDKMCVEKKNCFAKDWII